MYRAVVGSRLVELRLLLLLRPPSWSQNHKAQQPPPSVRTELFKPYDTLSLELFPELYKHLVFPPQGSTLPPEATSLPSSLFTPASHANSIVTMSPPQTLQDPSPPVGPFVDLGAGETLGLLPDYDGGMMRGPKVSNHSHCRHKVPVTRAHNAARYQEPDARLAPKAETRFGSSQAEAAATAEHPATASSAATKTVSALCGSQRLECMLTSSIGSAHPSQNSPRL